MLKFSEIFKEKKNLRDAVFYKLNLLRCVQIHSFVKQRRIIFIAKLIIRRQKYLKIKLL